MLRLRKAVFLAVLASVLSVFPSHSRVESYEAGIPGLSLGSIEFEVPDDWTSTKQGADSPSGVAIRFEPPGDKPFVLLVTPLPHFKPAGPAGRCEDMRSISEETRKRLVEIAEESEVPLHELRGTRACGFYASATDRTVEKPTREDFKYATQGAATNGQAMVSFTVLTNLRNPPELRTALEIVGSARHVGMPESAETALAGIRLAFPEKDWRLAVNLDGFELENAGPPQDGPGMHLVARRGDPIMIVSIFLDEDTRGYTAEGYRRWYRENHLRIIAGSKPHDIEQSERNGLPILEYSHTLENLDGKLRHMNAFMVHDGVWIDVHISMGPYESGARALFNEVFDSLSIAR